MNSGIRNYATFYNLCVIQRENERDNSSYLAFDEYIMFLNAALSTSKVNAQNYWWIIVKCIFDKMKNTSLEGDTSQSFRTVVYFE